MNLLNVLGVPWPYLDEDVISQFATFVREFGRAVQATHDDATRSVAAIAAAYRGPATDTMTSGWDKMSAAHVDEIVDGCRGLAGALDVAAGYLVTQKAEAIAVLVGLAASFVADQAAAGATAGIAEAAVPVIIAGAERVVKSLIMDLEQHVIGEVIEAAAKPLFAKIEDAMAGLDWSRSGAAAAGPASEIFLDPDALAQHLRALRSHAAVMRAHGTTFAGRVAGLAF